jgi:hypothetical protein
MLAAMEEENWPAVREYMRTILDIDPRNRRSPEPAVDYSRMPPLEFAPPPQQDENEDFWEVNQHNPMPALRALNIEDDWGAVDHFQPVINNIEDDWEWLKIINHLSTTK